MCKSDNTIEVNSKGSADIGGGGTGGGTGGGGGGDANKKIQPSTVVELFLEWLYPKPSFW